MENHAFEPQFYRRRTPSASPFWKIIAPYYDELERIHPDLYGAKYGFYRTALRIAADKFIKCAKQMRIISFIEKKDQMDVIEEDPQALQAVGGTRGTGSS